MRFGHWPAVRRCALALYLVGFVVWSYNYGIPVQRELVIVWVCGALACACIGRHPREMLWLVIDWLPMVIVLGAYDVTRGAGVSFLGIDVRDNNRQAALDFVNDRGVSFPSIFDPAMRTLIAFGGKYPTTVIPSTLVLDRQHRVAAVFLRELLAADLQPVVQKLAHEQ